VDGARPASVRRLIHPSPLDPPLDHAPVEARHVDLAVRPLERRPHGVVAKEEPHGDSVAGTRPRRHALHEAEVAEPPLDILR